MKKFPLTALSLALLALGQAAQAQQTTDIGKVTVTGEGDKLGTGLMIDEDTGKAKSTVTKAQIDKNRGSSNPYQLLNLLPGVNAGSYDATGLFGGNLRVRGFNSDEIGFTINGAPVNDSGNFAVYPQEYTDAENLCEIFVTQGSTDTEAPHVGASGGNIGLTTCAPKDQAGGKLSIGAGQLQFARVFVRGDTGLIGNFKGFLSASKSYVDKWKGPGKANRDHIDAAAEYKIGIANLSATMLWNKAVNNNYRALSLADLGTYGYFADFSRTIPQHAPPVNGVKQLDNSAATLANPSFNYNSANYAYYGYSLNPFENYLITGKASLQFSPALRLDIAPYYWYGYGTGGTEETTVGELANSGSNLHYGVADINKDGDTLDTVGVYRGSVTETHRPGVTTTLSYTLENQHILAGLWLERAQHRQTQPATYVDNNGVIGDIWLHNGDVLLKYNDGSYYQGRNTLTISTGESAFAQDAIDLFDSKLRLVPGISWRSENRDFTNYPSSGSGAGAYYQFKKRYSETLPNLTSSWQFSPNVQGFLGVAKNFKVPGNFDYFSLGRTGATTNGVTALNSIRPVSVQEETSVNLDTGFRYKNDLLKGSATAFVTKFKNRIASGYDPVAGGNYDINVGDSTIKGLELELGTVPVMGFSAYASASYTKSTIDGNIPSGATTVYPTAGKLFPDTPKGMAALSLQYASGSYLVNLAGKYTGPRTITLINDQRLAGYTTIDLNAAYQLPDAAVFKSPTIRFNLSNLGNKKYLLANAGSGSSISVAGLSSGLPGASDPTVYGGNPRFASITLQSDF